MNAESGSKPKVKLSVCVITYNQEKYIRQCLQSIVDQVTDFDFEVIVGDDCSTDGTRAIIEGFVSRYPDMVRAVYQEKNTGGSKNNLDVHAAACGEYVAHMDGDDYWFQSKLQAQVDFLDDNPKCNLVWTRLVYVYEDGTKNDLISDDNFFHKRFTRGDVIKYMAIGTNSSHMYRARSDLAKTPNFEVIDYYSNVEKVGDGYAAFVNDTPLTAYRVAMGLSSSVSGVELLYKTMRLFRKRYPENRSDLFASSSLMSYSSLKRKRFNLALRFLLLAISCVSVKAIREISDSLKIYKMLRVSK